jgi:4-hydroxy-tetrahydrodipicolinate synthase
MTASIRFEGTLTALVTPFKDDLQIDWDAFDRLVEGQIAGGVQGIVPCGTTGESPALDYEEQLELVKRCVKLAKGKCIVLAGTGTNSTRGTIAASQAAVKAGADAVMVVVPYYNKPTQDGLRQHYVDVASSVSGTPVVVYNIPGRTGIDLAADTLAKICDQASNVVAVKEATGNVLRAQEIVRLIGPRIAVLSGDDALALPMTAIGGRGVISVTSNLYPAEVSKTTRLGLEGKFEEARREHLALTNVHEAMFVESNPSPVKAALAHKGRMRDVVRGPLVKISEQGRAKVIAAVTTYENRK